MVSFDDSRGDRTGDAVGCQDGVRECERRRTAMWLSNSLKRSMELLRASCAVEDTTSGGGTGRGMSKEKTEPSDMSSS